MPAKRYTVEQIIAKLREAEKLQGQGMTIAQMCKRLQISDQTFFRGLRGNGAKTAEVTPTNTGKR